MIFNGPESLISPSESADARRFDFFVDGLASILFFRFKDREVILLPSIVNFDRLPPTIHEKMMPKQLQFQVISQNKFDEFAAQRLYVGFWNNFHCKLYCLPFELYCVFAAILFTRKDSISREFCKEKTCYCNENFYVLICP